MNRERITVQDCLDMLRCKGQATVLDNGRVTGFTENAPDPGGNPGQAQ